MLLVSRVRFPGAAVFPACGCPDAFHQDAEQREAQDKRDVDGKQRHGCRHCRNHVPETQVQQHGIEDPHHDEPGACVPVIYGFKKFLCKHFPPAFLKTLFFVTPLPLS